MLLDEHGRLIAQDHVDERSAEILAELIAEIVRDHELAVAA